MTPSPWARVKRSTIGPIRAFTRSEASGPKWQKPLITSELKIAVDLGWISDASFRAGSWTNQSWMYEGMDEVDCSLTAGLQ